MTFIFSSNYRYCCGVFFSLLIFTAVQTVEKVSIDKIRFFRVEQSYAVKSGKWYFEFEAVTGGDMRVGWARPGCRPDIELGSDDQAFVFEGSKVSTYFTFSTYEWVRQRTHRVDFLCVLQITTGMVFIQTKIALSCSVLICSVH